MGFGQFQGQIGPAVALLNFYTLAGLDPFYLFARKGDGGLQRDLHLQETGILPRFDRALHINTHSGVVVFRIYKDLKAGKGARGLSAQTGCHQQPERRLPN